MRQLVFACCLHEDVDRVTLLTMIGPKNADHEDVMRSREEIESAMKVMLASEDEESLTEAWNVLLNAKEVVNDRFESMAATVLAHALMFDTSFGHIALECITDSLRKHGSALDILLCQLDCDTIGKECRGYMHDNTFNWL